MALYWIGDLQGCDEAFGQLLAEVDFSPSRDTAYLLGDLVNRGPASLAVLRRLLALGDAARCILGNHDLHLLAVACGVRRAHRLDTCGPILDAPDRTVLLDWLRAQPLVRDEHGVLMVHAGVLPTWTRTQVQDLGTEVAQAIGPERSWAEMTEFFSRMYGNQPDHWSDRWQGPDRLRVIVNALTRLRFCTSDGTMEFESKEGAGAAPKGFLPWFEVPARATAQDVIACGHWSTLGLVNKPHLMSLDTGCVWGGCLSAIRVPQGSDVRDMASRELISVKCRQAQNPGQ
jgi:bis(5'-nucleosyl)-tetraphosphatase (symmetrical)